MLGHPRRRRAFAGLLVPIALFAAAPAAAAPSSSGNPWSEVSAAGYTAPAGTRCDFTLSSTVLQDKERIRTLSHHPDGTPRTQEVVGQLVVRFTNEESGASVERNLTGNGVFTWRADGTLQSLTLHGGHFAVGFAPTDPEGGAVIVFTGAGHEVEFRPDGTRVVSYGAGPTEDICQTLGG